MNICMYVCIIKQKIFCLAIIFIRTAVLCNCRTGLKQLMEFSWPTAFCEMPDI